MTYCLLPCTHRISLLDPIFKFKPMVCLLLFNFRFVYFLTFNTLLAAVGIRWVSVDSNFAGIPSVYYGRTWGTFCSDNWDINAARIFCINSGFQDAVYIASTTGGPVIPPSTIVNTISCTGEEEYFTDCPQIQWAYQGECRSGG